MQTPAVAVVGNSHCYFDIYKSYTVALFVDSEMMQTSLLYDTAYIDSRTAPNYRDMRCEYGMNLRHDRLTIPSISTPPKPL